jgi:hypothetical protein
MPNKTATAAKSETGIAGKNLLQLRICRTDGGIGRYSQFDPRKAAVLVGRFSANTMFSSGIIVVGTSNPMTLIKADEVAWIAVKTALHCPQFKFPDIDRCEMLAGKKKFAELLAEQWPRWRKTPSRTRGGLMQALLELTFRGGSCVYLNALGVVGDKLAPQGLFTAPVISAAIPGGGAIYINPRALVRARIYHSLREVIYPDGILVAEADEI